jgi:plastocyanin
MREFAFLILVSICVAFTCGCTAPGVSSQQAAPTVQSTYQAVTSVPNGPVTTVKIIASSFDPLNVNIHPGETVTWINKDRISHRVEHLPQLPSEKLLFRSESLSPGESFSYTFTEPGRYVYGDPQHGGGATTYLVIVS